MDRQRVRSKRGPEPGYGGRVRSSCGSRLYDSTPAQGGPSPRADTEGITCNIYTGTYASQAGHQGANIERSKQGARAPS